MASCLTKINQDMSIPCDGLQKRYIQRVVLINMDDIDKTKSTLTITCSGDPKTYSVSLVLKEGKTGYLVEGIDSSSSFSGGVSKSTSDLGFIQYQHLINLVVAGANPDVKCFISTLDKSNIVACIKFSDQTIEVYGYNYGLVTADYDYNLQENGGVIPLVLQSQDIALEDTLPLIYKSQVQGQEEADFEAKFANPSPNSNTNG